MLAQMGADDCQRLPRLKCLLLRKVGKANAEHFEDLSRRRFTGLKHDHPQAEAGEHGAGERLGGGVAAFG